MKTTTWKRTVTSFDALEMLLPGPAQFLMVFAAVTLAPLAATAGGVLAAVLIGLSGSTAETLVPVIGGTTALVYLGTAMVAARRGASSFDLGTAAVTAAAAIAMPGFAVGTLLVHTAWGVLRGVATTAPPGRCFAAAWAAFHGTAALLLSFSI